MSFAHYLLQVNLYLIVFYCFYKLLLDKETYFILNRIYLVAAGLLSLCIPFIRLEWLTEHQAAQQVYTSVNWDTVLQQATLVAEINTGFNWGNAFVCTYLAGILFFSGRLIFNLFSVRKLIHSPSVGSAFSFFGKKVIDKELHQAEVISIHEETHIKQWHTLDILFFELLGILTWLNPIIYFYKKSVKNIHEFLADEHAAAFQGDKAEYAMLILSKSFGISPNRLTNGFFNKSLIKKRIFMLQKERSKKTAVLKYGFFIPLFAILIVFSSATVRKNKRLISLSDQIPLDKPMEMVQEMVTKKDELSTELVTKSIIQSTSGNIDGNWDNFYRFVSRLIKYPIEAQKNGLQGNTQIKFTLKNIKVTNLSTAVNLGLGCDEEVMKAILSYKDFKNIPNGNYTLKVNFKLSDNGSKIKNPKVNSLKGYTNLSAITIVGFSNSSAASENSDKVFDFVSVEKYPEFPGGIAKFYQYLGKSIKYPSAAIENNVQGRIFVSFIVEKDGSLTDIKITRGLGSGTDEEAIRVLTESPRWNPGIAEGKPVRVKYNTAVNFSLANDTEKKTSIQIRPKNTEGDTNLDLDKFKGVIVIDGVTLSDNRLLNAVEPNNIESISVLKDQFSTGAYGLKGKDGVLLITTKEGKKTYLFRKPEVKELTIEKVSTYDRLKEKF